MLKTSAQFLDVIDVYKRQANTNEFQVARIMGTHPFYLKDYHSARRMYSDKHLTDAFAALLKADLSIKTTSLDDYTLLSVLIAEIIPD